MTLFQWIFLFIEVIISTTLVIILLFIVIREKDNIFSRKAFERLHELKRPFKVLSYLFILSLIFFLYHEIIEGIHHFHSSPSFFLNFFSNTRHILINLFFIPLQGLCLYLVLKLKEKTK